MFNKSVINVLSSINSITNSAILKYPVSVLNSVSGDVAVKLNVEALDKDEFPEIGIYNLSEFINTFKLFDASSVSISDGIISISDSEKSIQYLTSSINTLEPFNKDVKLFTSTEQVPSVVSFKLTKEDIKSIKSAAGVFKTLTDIVFEAKDGDVYIKLSATNNFNARSNSFSIKKPGITSTKEFAVRVPVDNFNSIPLSDYTFDIKYNDQRDAFRVLFTSTEIDLQIIMAIKKI